jgi:asparagine synthase (glutamine-hydrolysing)
VHLYAIASNIPTLTEEQLKAELISAGEAFVLDPATAWTASSRSATIIAAGIHHATERCGPRRYVSRTSSKVTWFDGLPVESEGRFQGCDAEALAKHWDALDDSLEGQFNAAQLDLDEERAEVLLDSLGLVQVFVAHRGAGLLISNNATLIASLLGLRSPDPLGVSSFLGLGWAAGESTLTGDVRVLCGGARHTLTSRGLETRRGFGPQSIPLRAEAPLSAGELAERMTTLTAGAVHGIERVGCALTAGRDTRVLLALLQAADERALYFTGGTDDNPDVVIAREIAERLALEHEVVCHDPASRECDWTQAAASFIRQNDGLVSLLQLPDYIDLTVERPSLGVKLGGVGGEIGRAGTGELTAVAANVPFMRGSVRVQRKLLAMKARNEAGLMTDEATRELGRYLDEFREQRLGEGWRPHELQEAFYTFERVGRWGASGRRLAGTDDGFLPFCSRAYINYCFSLRSGERFLEAPHYRLLSELSPMLRDHRFETPLQPQRTWLAPVLATRALAQAARERLMPARQSSNGAAAAAVQSPYPFQHAWLEGRLDLLRELFFASHSELWRFISRPRIEALLKGSEADRARNLEDLLRATTVFWHFHGRRA